MTRADLERRVADAMATAHGYAASTDTAEHTLLEARAAIRVCFEVAAGMAEECESPVVARNCLLRVLNAAPGDEL